MELQTKLNLNVSKTKHMTLKEAQSIMHPSLEPPQSIRFDKNSLLKNNHFNGFFHVIVVYVYSIVSDELICTRSSYLSYDMIEHVTMLA